MSNDSQDIVVTDATSGIPVGLSACLAGHNVRYNGGHSQSKLCLHRLGQYFDYKTFCPEVAAGFGTPRPTMRLTGSPDQPQLSYSNEFRLQNSELTEQLNRGFCNKLYEFSQLDGYILMKNSPSCGLERIKVYQENGYPHAQKGKGIFAKALQETYPLLPIEEEGRLHDGPLMENFVLRVFVHHNFRHSVRESLSYHNLLLFHSRYKMVVLAHNQRIYRRLGRMLAEGRNSDLVELSENYFRDLMMALSKPARRGDHANVMLHLLGHLKKSVPGKARQNIVTVIEQYQCGQVPLITPITLLRHYIDREANTYLRAQCYLAPYPEDLSLRSQL